jgi:hypothetical protein
MRATMLLRRAFLPLRLEALAAQQRHLRFVQALVRALAIP